jgi:RNA polymerase sigma-70 factor (ECF subfamily)
MNSLKLKICPFYFIDSHDVPNIIGLAGPFLYFNFTGNILRKICGILQRRIDYLINSGKKMDAKNFNSQLISLQERLSSIALNYTTNREDAQDLLQETLLKAIDSREKFHEDTNLLAWATTIMKNTYINTYRRKTLTRKAFDHNGIDGIMGDHFWDMTHSTSLYSEVNEVVKMLESIDDDFKIPFNLHLQGFKYKEIAKKLNLNLGTVKSRIFCARRKLTSMAAG